MKWGARDRVNPLLTESMACSGDSCLVPIIKIAIVARTVHEGCAVRQSCASLALKHNFSCARIAYPDFSSNTLFPLRHLLLLASDQPCQVISTMGTREPSTGTSAGMTSSSLGMHFTLM